MAATGARLRREDRREQLLQLGEEAVRATSFDAVSVEQVAEAAGISRGLLFHYFPSRRAFLHAIAQRAADRLLAMTDPPGHLPPLERLRQGLRAYVAEIVEQPDAYVSMIRGAGGGDPEMRAIVDGARMAYVDRILQAVRPDDDRLDPMLRVAVRGWLGFVEEAAIAWLAEDEATDRAAFVDMLEGLMVALAATLGVELDPAPRAEVTATGASAPEA